MNNKIFGLGFAHFNDNQNHFNNLIQTGLANGIQYFEGCSFYNHSNCENNLNLSLINISREKYLLGDKLSNEVCEKQFHNNLEEYFNYQLKQCNTTYFDYYLIQYVNKNYFTNDGIPNGLFKTQYDFLLQKKQEGKIKNIGFVYHYMPECFEECFLKFKWDCVQFSLNYYRWKYGYAKQLYKISLKYQTPIIAMEPLAMGYLTDSQDIIKASYNFLMTLNNIGIILNGTTNAEHLNDNLNILKSYNKLTKKDLKLLDFCLEHKNLNICNSCNECIVNCPKNIDLKKIMEIKNNKYKKEYYKSYMPFFEEINKCINCNESCVVSCRKKINFPYIIWQEIFPLRI